MTLPRNQLQKFSNEVLVAIALLVMLGRPTCSDTPETCDIVLTVEPERS